MASSFLQTRQVEGKETAQKYVSESEGMPANDKERTHFLSQYLTKFASR